MAVLQIMMAPVLMVVLASVCFFLMKKGDRMQLHTTHYR